MKMNEKSELPKWVREVLAIIERVEAEEHAKNND